MPAAHFLYADNSHKPNHKWVHSAILKREHVGQDSRTLARYSHKVERKTMKNDVWLSPTSRNEGCVVERCPSMQATVQVCMQSL